MTIAEKLQKLDEIKRQSLGAIQAKGVDLKATDPFEVYPSAIEAIPQELNISDGSVGGVPDGCIVMWSGPVENIPNGWALCDGQNGTPDLRGRFVLGYQEPDENGEEVFPVGSTGGKYAVKLGLTQIPAHTHQVTTFEPILVSTGTSGVSRTVINDFNVYGETGETGGASVHENMPPYYVLCYIMKLPTLNLENVYEEGEKVIGSFMGKPLYRLTVFGTTASEADTHSPLDVTLHYAVMVRYGGCLLEMGAAGNPFPNWSINLIVPSSNIPYVRLESTGIANIFANRKIAAWFEYTKEPVVIPE